MRTRHIFLGLLTVALIGCNKDADGDGWGEKDDCNDADAAINPDADEVCDGEDNDCDDLTDEDDDGLVDASTFFGDADGDGFGSDATTEEACELPSGFADNADDCDDSVASTNPDADELCDGADNDCDGETDEDSAADAPTWYADLDLDGFGDDATAETSCEAPAGYIADNTDCDDAADFSYPGAPEVCDGFDNDCDGAELDYGAGWVPAVGDAMDVTSAVEGRETSLELLTIEEEGTLYFCGGEFWTSIEITEPVPVSIIGVGGPELTTLLGGTIDHSGDDGAYPSDAMDLLVSGLSFDANTVDTGFGVVTSQNGHLTVSDSVFTETFSYTSGGAATYYGDLTLDGVEALDFTGGYGAAFSYAGSITVRDSLMVGGNSTAIFAADTSGLGSVTVETTTIEDFDYVAVLAYNPLAITDSTITNSSGGVQYGTSLACSGTTVSDSSESGGVVGTGPATLDACSLTGNTSTGQGGGLKIDGDLTATDSTIRGNDSGGSGGGIYTTGNVVLTNTDVSDNTAFDFGAGLHALSGDVTATGSSFSNNVLTTNTAQAFGAGISVGDYSSATGGDLWLEDCTVADNASDYAAGGIWAWSGDVDLVDSVVSGNSAQYVGGVGVPLGDLSCTGSPDIEAGAWGNSATVLGGGFWYSNGSVTAVDCDMGVDATDNTPDDVNSGSTGDAYTDYGADANFSCDGSGCI